VGNAMNPQFRRMFPSTCVYLMLAVRFSAMVYVGKREYSLGRMIMSHMAADSLDELHLMAKRIGVAKRHFQDKKDKPHYDICKQNKLKAIELGAVEVDDRKIIELYRALAK
jgi:hypothetical protein